MSATVAALLNGGRPDQEDWAGGCDEWAAVVVLPAVAGDQAGETPRRPAGLAIHAPVVYRLTKRKAEAWPKPLLRQRERLLRHRVRRHRDRGAYAHLDWVRLYAMRHVLEDGGETLGAV